MTSSPPTPDALEAMPIPAGAVLLPASTSGTPRALALAGLRQALKERLLDLPLGPSLDPEDPDRVLSLNRFALQLATTGISSDQLLVDPGFWQQSATAPQLLLAAAVGEDDNVVYFPGVLTAEEFIAQASTADREDGLIALDVEVFNGGIERLLTLVQLLEPSALPRLALNPSPTVAIDPRIAVASVLDWLNGQLDSALSSLGAQLQPATAAAFRGVGATASAQGSLGGIVIPLGLDNGQLVAGPAAAACVESFQLALIPIGSSQQPESLLLKLVSSLDGDLLPDGLELIASQGSYHQLIRSTLSSRLELSFPAGDELISVSLNFPGSGAIQLPPLQLPRP